MDVEWYTTEVGGGEKDRKQIKYLIILLWGNPQYWEDKSGGREERSGFGQEYWGGGYAQEEGKKGEFSGWADKQEIDLGRMW